MRLQILTVPISPRGVYNAVDFKNIPGDVPRSGKLQHSCLELLINQVIVPELALRPIPSIAFEQVMKDFWFADICNRGDFDIVIFQRKVIEVSTNLAQPHKPDSDFTITHDCTPFN
jgi:hypothetical protein